VLGSNLSANLDIGQFWRLLQMISGGWRGCVTENPEDYWKPPKICLPLLSPPLINFLRQIYVLHMVSNPFPISFLLLERW